jgi:hypothetical protein
MAVKTKERNEIRRKQAREDWRERGGKWSDIQSTNQQPPTQNNTEREREIK